LHGHDFVLLAEGKGVFTESILTTVNLINPTRRDVVTMPVSDPTSDITGGYIVIAFLQNNPGVWVIHPKTLLTIAIALPYRLAYFDGSGNSVCRANC
jgi:Multicopper oxidase